MKMQQNNHNLPSSAWAARLWQWRALALLLIGVGLMITTLYGVRSLQSYREFQSTRAERREHGPAHVETIRSWMTVRYVGVAYAVPEEYIFARLEIPYNRRNSQATLRQLNNEYEMGISSLGPYPKIIDRVTEAIQDYRANPLPPGLRGLRPWMTLRYISSSTGVPEAYLLEAIALDAAHAAELDATLLPLDQLAMELQLSDGPEALFIRLEEAIEQYEAAHP